MVGSHAQRVNVTVCTVGSEPWRGSLSDRILMAETGALLFSFHPCQRHITAAPDVGRRRETLTPTPTWTSPWGCAELGRSVRELIADPTPPHGQALWGYNCPAVTLRSPPWGCAELGRSVRELIADPTPPHGQALWGYNCPAVTLRSPLVRFWHVRLLLASGQVAKRINGLP